jgi:hypothetical protein
MMKVDDEGLVRTHDAARELLRYAVPGATVVIEPVWPPHPTARQWAMVLDAAPSHAVQAFDTYTLPVTAESLYRRARTLAEEGLRSLAEHRRRT